MYFLTFLRENISGEILINFEYQFNFEAAFGQAIIHKIFSPIVNSKCKTQLSLTTGKYTVELKSAELRSDDKAKTKERKM